MPCFILPAARLVTLPVLALAFLGAIHNLVAARAGHGLAALTAFCASPRTGGGRCRPPFLNRLRRPLVYGCKERGQGRPVEKIVDDEPLTPHFVPPFHEFHELRWKVSSLSAGAESPTWAASHGVDAASIVGVGLAGPLNGRRKQRGPKVKLSRSRLYAVEINKCWMLGVRDASRHAF